MSSIDVEVTDHSRRRSSRPWPAARRRLRNRCGAVALAAAATAALAAPAGALAADPPTILTAGINAQDELYATWTVAPGTTFDFVTFATVPDPDPDDPTFFPKGNFAGFCDPVIASATCTATSYTAQYPTGRDRRYFVKVSTKVTGTTATYRSSAVWVIDDAKPQIAGDAALGADPPTNKPVAGHLLGTAPPPPPPPPAPVATIKLLSVPKTFASLNTKGVRATVTCTVTCSSFGRLQLGSSSLGTKRFTLTGGGLKTLVVKPSSIGRRLLSGRRRARIKITATAAPFNGSTKKVVRAFTVHR